MKIILSIVILLFSFNFANAQIQDDRYFDSRKIYGKTTQKVKVVKKWRYRYPGPALVANAFRAAVIPAGQVLAPATRAITGAAAGLSGIVAPLAAKATEIINACGSRVSSGVRIGSRVAGSGRLSLHHSGQAVDMVGNPSCIYAQLQGWPGGYSTDYGRVNHVHISYGGSEHGIRFVHNSGKRWYGKRRYARMR